MDTFPVQLTRKVNYGWTARTGETITDEQASRLTFRAVPADVVMGEFVQVVDAAGTRIGHISGATYHERLFGPAYVTCSITLR